MSFHPRSEAYTAHPRVGLRADGPRRRPLPASPTPTAAPTRPASASGARDYLPFLESRLREAIANWQVKLFKFDFLVWLDCPGVNDMYEVHDRFLALIDRLRAEFPDVAFSIDETNDYRLFPFESTLRGPTWFTNGGPSVAQILHNTWPLAPWVPALRAGPEDADRLAAQGQPGRHGVASTLLNQHDDHRRTCATRGCGRDRRRGAAVDRLGQGPPRGLPRRRDLPAARPTRSTASAGPRCRPGTPTRAAARCWPSARTTPRESVSIALRNVRRRDLRVRSAPDDALVGDGHRGRSCAQGIEVAAPRRGAEV